MSDFEKQRGKREAPSAFPPAVWWGKHRAWVRGLSRGARVRYRVCLALGIIALLALIAAVSLRAWIRLPEVPVTPNVPAPPVSSAGSQGNISQSQVGLEYEGAELPQVTRSGQKPGYYTFLLCGQDEVSGATDTIILITYDTKSKAINAISLLRDTMINTSASSKRLNTVYARNRGSKDLPEKDRVAGGMAALKQEVSKLTGIYPNFYVLVKWEAIGELVDAIGGVEFEVPFLMDYKDPYQDLVIYQKPGLRLLSGRDAMEVIRFRKNSDGTHILGDSGRTQIQRDFLTAVIKECLQPDILLKLPALAQVFLDNVSTDLTIGNILAFAELAIGMDTDEDVNFCSMPFDNASYRGAALALARQDELLEVLNSGINPYVEEIQASDLQLMYRKRGGGFDVTNAALADAAVGKAPVAEPKPSQTETPGEKDPAGEPAGDEPGQNQTGQNQTGQNQPGQSQTGQNQPEQNQPPAGGESTPSGEDGPLENIGEIDPSDIFPDPAPKGETGEGEGSQTGPGTGSAA